MLSQLIVQMQVELSKCHYEQPSSNYNVHLVIVLHSC